MKAKVISGFNASLNGRELRCEAGDTVEADKKTIAQLERIGLVTTRAGRRKGGKAAKND